MSFFSSNMPQVTVYDLQAQCHKLRLFGQASMENASCLFSRTRCAIARWGAMEDRCLLSLIFVFHLVWFRLTVTFFCVCFFVFFKFSKGVFLRFLPLASQ